VLIGNPVARDRRNTGSSSRSAQLLSSTSDVALQTPAALNQNQPMIKLTQIFGWEHEPVAERPSEFVPSRLSAFAELSSFGALDPAVRAAASPAKKTLIAPEASRSPPSDSDRSLSALVPRWLESLSPEVMPRYLCTRFPRIANRLALCWADPALTVRLLDDFFLDKRGTRRGFPPEAMSELKRLRQVASRRSNTEA
jgi:hypothetical protein